MFQACEFHYSMLFSLFISKIDDNFNLDIKILILKIKPVGPLSLSLSKWLPVQALPEEKLSHRVPRVQPLLAGPQGLPRYTILILTIE